MQMLRDEHWNRVYRTKADQDVSWFEPTPKLSLRMIEAAGLASDTCIVDVGGGDSRLVDALLRRGLHCLAVLDVSGEALRRAQRRLGVDARVVTWIEADVTAAWSLKPMDIWHDRAVFHFLVDARDRTRYLEHVRDSLKPQGSVIIATFALDGPPTCSGLPVARYSPESLAIELGEGFTLEEARPYHHTTPWGATQSFQYSRFRRTQ
jgi:SAM-dependent methyltransferase